MKNILVVEDNPSNMYLIEFILVHNGYGVIKAESGEACLELIVKEHVDMILMDIQLPGMDGLMTTRRIRESGYDGVIPIVALTSYAMTGDRQRALEAGCNGYIEKPINPDTLIDEIESFL